VRPGCWADSVTLLVIANFTIVPSRARLGSGVASGGALLLVIQIPRVLSILGAGRTGKANYRVRAGSRQLNADLQENPQGLECADVPAESTNAQRFSVTTPIWAYRKAVGGTIFLRQAPFGLLRNGCP